MQLVRSPRLFLRHGFAALLSAGLALASPARAAVDQVIVVFKTHFDIGYTDMASNVVQRYRTTMIDQALGVCDQFKDLPADQQFAWTLPGWPLKTILEDWPGQQPARKQRVLGALRQGRFVVHALPFTTHTELLEMEDLVRGLDYASRLSRSVGLPLPRDAKMTDVPCHIWFVPTLLRHAGVDFLHLGCNAASRSPELPPLFWWEGPDGSRLLTMYTAESYGTGLVPPADWPHRTWLALVHTGDNHGPPTPEEVKALLREAGEKLPGVKVRIGRLSDFSDALLAEKPTLPVVRGDMPDTWIHGPMCDPQGARLARLTRPALAAAESLNTLERTWGLAAPEIASTLAGAYEQSLLYGEHTWGGALYWVTAYSAARRLPYGEEWKSARAKGTYARIESSWAEHTAYIERAHALLEPVLADGLTALARSVDAKGRRAVVYNPLPWARDGVVRVRWPGGAPAAFKPVGGGPNVLVDRDGEDLVFVAKDVPAMGYRTYVPAKKATKVGTLKVDEASATLESPHFTLKLDPQAGVIRSLVAKRTGEEWVEPGAPHAFGQYLYERFDSRQVQDFVDAYVKIKADWASNELGKPNLPPPSEVPYRAAVPSGFNLRLDRTAVAAMATMHAPPGEGLSHGVTTRVILYRDLPCLDLEITLEGKPADPWPEAGWICLPFKIDSPRFRLARLGSVIDPAKDIVPGANRHLLALEGGLTITDPAGLGLGLCALDSPLVSLQTPGCWKFSRDFVPHQGRVYVNLFNNQWTTNFRLWNEGTWSARVRLWALTRPEDRDGLIVPSVETRQPLLAGMADGPAGKLSAVREGVALSRKGVLVTAFGRQAVGGPVVLRLWEQAGQAGPCVVRLPRGMRADRVQPVNLRGEPLGVPIPLRQGLFETELKAFAPASFKLLEP